MKSNCQILIFYWRGWRIFSWKTKQLLSNLMFLWVKIGEAQNHAWSKYALIYIFFTCNNFCLKMLLHKKRPFTAKPPRCLTSDMKFVTPSVVLTQMFAEHVNKQIPGIILVKMKTTPLLFGGIFLVCNPTSSCISRLGRSANRGVRRVTSTWGMRGMRERSRNLSNRLHCQKHLVQPDSDLLLAPT